MTLREKLEQLKASEDKNEAIIDAFVLGCMVGITAGENCVDAEFDTLMDADIEVEEVED